MDGVDQQYLVALDKKSGDTVWRTDRDVEWHDQDVTGKSPEAAKRILDGDMRKAHSTPLIVKLPDGEPLMLSCGAMSSFAYDPRNGKERWRIIVDDFSVSPRPVYHDGIAYMLTGNIHPELWAIRADAKGNLTETDDVLWRQNQGISHTSSPLLVDGLIYMANDDGIIRCFDAETGNARLARARRQLIRRIADLCRRPHLLLRSRRHIHRHQTRPQVRSSRHQHARRRPHGVARRRRTSAHPPHQDPSLPHRKCGAGCQLRPSLSGRRLAVARRGQVARNSPWRGEGALNQRRVLTSQTIRRPSRSIRELPASQPANRPVGVFRACSLHNRDRSNTSWVLAATR